MTAEGTNPHGLEERIAAAVADGSLARRERDVARFFVERAEDVPFMSASQIAKATGVGAATVVRTAQALGYSGLPEVKREAQNALYARVRPTHRLARSLEGLGSAPAAILDRLLDFQIGILSQARESLSSAEFGRAVELLRTADRVAVLGYGTQRFQAELLTHSLRIGGHSSFAIVGRGVAVAEELMELRRGDALVALAYEKAQPEVRVALDHAGTLRVPRVLVTDTLALALKNQYEVVLSARRGDPTGIPTAVLTVAIVEALHMALAAADRASSIEANELLNALRAELH